MPFTLIANGDTGLTTRTELNNVFTFLNTYGLRVQYSNDGVSWSYTFTTGDDYIRFLDVDGNNPTDALQFGGGASWDSAEWNSGTGDLTFKIGATPDATVNIDGRYALATDAVRNNYEVSLPSSTTVAGRIAGAVEGTDYPTGWVLSDSGVDLDMTHGLGRRVINVTIFSEVSGTVTQLLQDAAAYNTIENQSDNIVRIKSLATIQKRIYIYLIFAHE